MLWSIREAPDLAPFKWIEDGLRSPVGLPAEEDNAVRTLDLVPPQFEAYAKVFHPIYEDPAQATNTATWEDEDEMSESVARHPALQKLWEKSTLVRTGIDGAPPPGWRRVLWAELAQQLKLDYGPALSALELDGAWPGRSWPARLSGPDEGDFILDMVQAVISAIRAEGDPGLCFFWWWVVACMGVFDSGDPRDFLFRGRLRGLPRFLRKRGASSPTYWWPENRAWCVATDWDLCFTVVGGSTALVGRLLADPEVEALAVGENDALLMRRTN